MMVVPQIPVGRIPEVGIGKAAKIAGMIARRMEPKRIAGIQVTAALIHGTGETLEATQARGIGVTRARIQVLGIGVVPTLVVGIQGALTAVAPIAGRGEVVTCPVA